MLSAPVVVEPTQAAVRPFDEDAGIVLSQLRSALASLIQATPGNVRRPTQLQRMLRVDSSLAWQVYRAAASDDPLAVGRHLPGAVAMSRVFKAARGLAMSEAVVREAERAYSAFQMLIDRHAGDRRTFNSMLAGISDDGKQGTDLKQRRAAFRANSHLWGLQARVALTCLIVHPGQTEGAIDMVQLTGAVDLRPLRRDVQVRIGDQITVKHEVTGDNPGFEPVRKAFKDQDPGLLTEFCSRPLPELTHRRKPDGTVEIMIQPRTLGKAGTLTYFRQLVGRNANEGRRETKFETNRFVSFPIEVQLVDLLVPSDLVDRSTVAVASFACPHDPKAALLQRPEDRMETSARPLYLGHGLEAARTPDIPRYPDLLQHIMGSLGWKGETLDVFRVRLEFPQLHSSTLIKVHAPGEPQQRGRGKQGAGR